MTRKGFVGFAGAVAVAAFLAHTPLAAQDAAPKSSAPAKKAAPKKAAPEKAAPETPAPNPDKKPAAAMSMSKGGGGAVPATTPTPQPEQGAANEPKVAAANLMSVHIPKKVTADGKPLPAGTYTVRVTTETAPPVVGQTTSESHWVEFLQGGKVVGREVATVLTNSEAKTIAKQGLPAAGGVKIETLYGNDYLRVWVNKAGTNYLVHLPNS
jgi:hypothetical protein